MSDQDDRVSLRLVHEDDLPLLADLTQDPEQTGEFQWFGWHDLRRWRRDWNDNGLIGPDSGTLMVTRDAERLGLVHWHRQLVTVAAYTWEIGVIRDGAWRDGVIYSLLRTDPRA